MSEPTNKTRAGNVVSLDQAVENELPEGLNEDAFTRFVLERKKMWAGLGLGILLGFFALQGMDWMDARYIEKLQSGYKAAVTNEEKAAFASQYKAEPLAGITYLEMADAAYREGDYTSAHEYYADSTPGLHATPFEEHARKGSQASSRKKGVFSY